MKDFLVTPMPVPLSEVEAEVTEVTNGTKTDRKHVTRKQNYYTVVKQSELTALVAKLKDPSISEATKAQIKSNITRLVLAGK